MKVINTIICVIFALVISGCSFLPKQIIREKVYLPKPSPTKNNEMADEYFRFCKLQYEICNFEDGIRNCLKSIENESSNSKKARTYIYIGACYFYADDIESAKFYFKKAKRTCSRVNPSSREFAPEIVQLFNAS